MARVGGRLEINCADYGDDVPKLYSGAALLAVKDMKEKGNGRFVIEIDSQLFAKTIRCVCEKKTGLMSTNPVSVSEVFCSPQGPVCQNSNDVCLLQTDGSGKCEKVGSYKFCMQSGLRSPPYAFKVLVDENPLASAKENCEAMKNPTVNEKWGQVEMKASAALQIMGKCKRIFSNL